MLLLLGSIGCDVTSKKRPYGYVKLGLASEVATRPETFFSDQRVIIRHDESGFSAMSTACTYDLSALTRVSDQGTRQWASSYSSSLYDDQGRVLKGPARTNLPYYRVELAAGTYGGVPDTLFVQVGVDVDPTWRLQWRGAK
jgi:Rieske Fe-S protein